MRYIFLSPHMDDAILSAGSFLIQLTGKNLPITVVTIFSEFGSLPISWDSRKYIFHSGFLRLSSFIKARKLEEDAVMKALNISSILLKFIDGGFRKTDSGKLIYQNHDELMNGTISINDVSLIHNIEKRLRVIIKRDDVLVAPLGVGGHADHLIVNKVSLLFPNKILYWLDQPYARNLRLIRPNFSGYKVKNTIRKSRKKEKLVRLYKSQFSQLFPSDSFDLPDETFYTRYEL
jgi:LmbE family N-acetylglucosaminyl deacetylase